MPEIDCPTAVGQGKRIVVLGQLLAQCLGHVAKNFLAFLLTVGHKVQHTAQFILYLENYIFTNI